MSLRHMKLILGLSLVLGLIVIARMWLSTVPVDKAYKDQEDNQQTPANDQDSSSSDHSSSTDHSSSSEHSFSQTKIDSKFIQQLKQHLQKLIESQRSLTHSARLYQQMEQHVQDAIKMLKMLDETNIENGPSNDIAKSEKSENLQEVCPEKFGGKQLNYGFPFYRKGFERVNCTNFVPLHQLITLLISLPEELPKPADSYVEIMKGIAKRHPKIRVILATEKPIEDSTKSSISNLDIAFENFEIAGIWQSTLWKQLVEKVETPYVFIAPDLTHFDDDINLERLVRMVSYIPEVVIAGGSYRNLTGHWDIGCQQVSFLNWTATYKGGYYRSLNECVLCDFMPGPWVSKTKLLKDLDFDRSLQQGAFRDLFWRLKKKQPEKITVSCPDVMFNINTRDTNDESLVAFANKHSIHRIVEPCGRVRWYGCRLGYSYTSGDLCPKERGLSLSPADMENLADAVKFIMKECEIAGVYCEIQDGTLVGSLKFNGVLPWERDADVTFLTSNYSAIEKLKSRFREAGYSLSPERGNIITINGLPHGGYFGVGLRGWRIELWGMSIFDTVVLAARGKPPTKLSFAGQWLNHPRNPGLMARNRYGPGLYQHAEHWGTTGGSTGWAFYSTGKFSACSRPGHSGCLNLLPGDGNMQFRSYCP